MILDGSTLDLALLPLIRESATSGTRQQPRALAGSLLIASSAFASWAFDGWISLFRRALSRSLAVSLSSVDLQPHSFSRTNHTACC